MSLTIVKRLDGNVLTIQIRGEMDYSTMQEGVQLVDIPDGATHIIVDFSEMTFIDSTGVGSVIGLLHAGADRGADVTLRGMSDDAREVFETIGIFQIAASMRRER